MKSVIEVVDDVLMMMTEDSKVQNGVNNQSSWLIVMEMTSGEL